MVWQSIVWATATGFLGAVAAPGHAPVSVLQVAAEVGVTADGLACSGFVAADAAAMLARLEAATDERAALAESWQAVQQQGPVVTAARAEAEANRLDTALRAEFDAATTTYRNLVNQLRTRQGALFDVAVNGCAMEAVDRLRLFNTARLQGLPPAMRVVNWSASTLESLQRAVVAEQRAARRNEYVQADAATTLANARSNAAVADAEQWLVSRKAAIASAFEPSP